MKKVQKKLSKEQIKKGIIFTSTLSKTTTEQDEDTTHEVLKSHIDKEARIDRLLNDSFFNRSPWNFNIIRQ
jgi:hypothetical protein